MIDLKRKRRKEHSQRGSQHFFPSLCFLDQVIRTPDFSIDQASNQHSQGQRNSRSNEEQRQGRLDLGSTRLLPSLI
ncbi:hypothetical protein CBS147339_1282 [Penicillium roqueforti]|uniref:uncharacterized protein n=1 Tax=Penicillium roqueforti TaxID=5082 RepID=UPI00190D76CB|nr:uncharacterized protein LCP9604111_279 [Penicillium roqueforti]KAF9252753.1 hypothetical protein LCP9604111_279 [Penicillium roqueforti]KAI2675348.1 hypothetical protein CBS147355_6342 [Penicillium roqueforti]KAI2686963.1 hypothetical protein LCP963914a_3564 [Penicillium roqueforti]KAI2720593.1 hypothetical protein CBS147332_3833 [Penicillium roqueforti]KAI2724235.1 hypothetical protein CBS147318_1166 [Penicillium roqueforti]